MPISNVAGVITETPAQRMDEFLLTGVIRTDALAIRDVVDYTKQVAITTANIPTATTITLSPPVATGGAATVGTAVLNGTTAVVVATTAVTAASNILLTINTPAGTPASPYVFTRTAGTSFSIKSTGGSDTSTVSWFIVTL